MTTGESQESAIRQFKDALSSLRYTTVALFMLLLVAFPLLLLFGPRFWLGIPGGRYLLSHLGNVGTDL